MSPQTKEYEKEKLNTFWREIILLDDALVRQPSPTHKELWRRAYETCISQEAADGHDPEDWGRDLSKAIGNRA